jgi:hypothetical protein
MKMTVLWDVVPCSLVCLRFQRSLLPLPSGSVNLYQTTRYNMMVIVILTMEAGSFSESSVSIKHTTRCNIPKGSHLHACRRENLMSHQFYYPLQRTYSIETVLDLVVSKSH